MNAAKFTAAQLVGKFVLHGGSVKQIIEVSDYGIRIAGKTPRTFTAANGQEVELESTRAYWISRASEFDSFVNVPETKTKKEKDTNMKANSKKSSSKKVNSNSVKQNAVQSKKSITELASAIAKGSDTHAALRTAAHNVAVAIGNKVAKNIAKANARKFPEVAKAAKAAKANGFTKKEEAKTKKQNKRTGTAAEVEAMATAAAQRKADAVKKDELATANKMRALREKAGLSIKEVAAKCKRSVTNITFLEHGRRRWNEEIVALYTKACK